MKSKIMLTVALFCAGLVWAGPSALEQGFSKPPEETKPACYWYWISDNISKEGITKDLEAMARVGIGEAFVGNVDVNKNGRGNVKVLSEEWWGMVEHAIREGGRVGVNVGLFNCPGWSQSGGPWVKPEQAMRYVALSQTRIKGPVHFEGKIPVAKAPFQDIALLAVPAPAQDQEAIATRKPQLASIPEVKELAQLMDGNLDTACTFPRGAKEPITITFTVPEPYTARSLVIHPAPKPLVVNGELQALVADGQWQSVRKFTVDRHNPGPGVGTMPYGPVSVAFAPVTSRQFRILFTGANNAFGVAEIELTGAARIEHFVEKQLAKMFQDPLPMWDAYLWPAPPALDAPGLAIKRDSIMDLSGKLSPDGTLRWDVPAGDWIVLRTGMTPTGASNSPASPEGTGLEIDKLNKQWVGYHFDAFIGKVLARLPASDRKAFRRVIADSYEMGAQNWTDDFANSFQQRFGYDPIPWLPALTGRVVENPDLSDRFLWDMRRLVADRVARDYVGGLREKCEQNGLRLWLENYGHWGFPAEFLQYGGQSHDLGGEFWATGDLGSIELRAASSAANTYGKSRVSAEAFTGGPAFKNSPMGLKARGDWAFCEGINHFVLHVYIHQPDDQKVPGINAWFGTEFNRHNTWFENSRSWIDYLRRSCFLLQQGTRVADVAYFIGEDAPKMTGIRKPELPPGYDFDYINAEVILDKLTVVNGLLTLPHGTTYRLLVLPELATMRPNVLRKVRDLVQAGAMVLGPPPLRSPSMESYPECDREVQNLATELWGTTSASASIDRAFGRGRVIFGKSVNDYLKDWRIMPDFQSNSRLLYTHRRSADGDFYFVTNPQSQPVSATLVFRMNGKIPELWSPMTGAITYPVTWNVSEGKTHVSLPLGANESVFVVFREVLTEPRPIITQVVHDNVPIRTTAFAVPSGSVMRGVVSNDFSVAFWVKPNADAILAREQNSGVHRVSDPRIDIINPPHGNTFAGEGLKAGFGLTVGRNGICVVEHGASYLAPVLVHPAAITDLTHVTIVYRQGQAELYLNGVSVRKGLKGPCSVFFNTGEAGGNGSYQGLLGSLQRFDREISPEEILQLMKQMPKPGKLDPALAIELATHPNNKVAEARVWSPGGYELTSVNTSSRQTLYVTNLPNALSLEGQWELRFTPGWGAPDKLQVDRLMDLTERPEEAIKYYSGKVTYRKTFAVPANVLSPTTCIRLDLGKVCDLAVIRINGKEVATLWMPPWTVDVGEFLKAGQNTLEIDVVNPWNNRLVGDLKLPPEKRRTQTAEKTVNEKTPLLPAGLLGPVKVEFGRKEHIKAGFFPPSRRDNNSPHIEIEVPQAPVPRG